MRTSRYIAVLFLAAQVNAPAAFADDPGVHALPLPSYQATTSTRAATGGKSWSPTVGFS